MPRFGSDEHLQAARLGGRQGAADLVAGVQVELAGVGVEARVLELERLQRAQRVLEGRVGVAAASRAEGLLEARGVGRRLRACATTSAGLALAISTGDSSGSLACSASVSARPSQAKPPPGPGRADAVGVVEQVGVGAACTPCSAATARRAVPGLVAAAARRAARRGRSAGRRRGPDRGRSRTTSCPTPTAPCRRRCGLPTCGRGAQRRRARRRVSRLRRARGSARRAAAGQRQRGQHRATPRSTAVRCSIGRMIRREGRADRPTLSVRAM